MKQYICCNFEDGVCPNNCIHSKPHIPKEKDCILEYDGSVACWIKHPTFISRLLIFFGFINYSQINSKIIPSYCIPISEKYLSDNVHKE